MFAARTFGELARPQRRDALVGRTVGAVALLLFGIAGCSPDGVGGPREFDDVAVVGLAPGPESNQESIVQLYAARSYE